MATAIEVDSVEILPDIELDNNKSNPSAQSFFCCDKKMDDFMHPCIVSDKMMDVGNDKFALDIDIVEAPLSRPRIIPKEYSG